MSESFPPQPPAPQSPPPAPGGLADNVASALAYFTIIPAVLFLLIEPYKSRPLVRFHSFQSIAFVVASFLLHVVVHLTRMMLHWIPLIGLAFMLLDVMVALVLFLVWLFVVYKASQGEWYKLPVLGDFAEQQARA
ncbi:MAG: DUF4870 domain-containing protein [Acidobacteriota bacterium]|nr:DUF4870 domain-containing protein [Acidobacteriota bacterium]